ncbi:MAG: tripartite tricarboxylate transporter substrate binding protein BugD [Hyphomicrobiales bacterium]|nr:tripartite tricarboxylate transporter substrate binding protein BugD [Hyphomicrobiales bacterium]
MKRRLLMGAIALGLVGAAAPIAARAQDYPQRPITLIVPYVAGGPTDVTMRIITTRMSAILGQQIVIENVGGAGGATGSLRAARAAPDGYTLLGHQNGLATIPALYPKLGLEVEKELAAIGLVNRSYSFLIGRKSLPADSAAELVAWMKGPARPARFAHPGIGSLAHLMAVMIAQAAGVEASFVPYRGGGPAMNDLVAEHVDVLIAAPTLSVPLINRGAIKVFAGGAAKAAGLLPQVPSFAAVGLGEADLDFWQALFAPAGTPRPIIDRLNAALREALLHPDVVRSFTDIDAVAYPRDQQTPEAATALLAREIAVLGKVIRDNKIQDTP